MKRVWFLLKSAELKDSLGKLIGAIGGTMLAGDKPHTLEPIGDGVAQAWIAVQCEMPLEWTEPLMQLFAQSVIFDAVVEEPSAE